MVQLHLLDFHSNTNRINESDGRATSAARPASAQLPQTQLGIITFQWITEMSFSPRFIAFLLYCCCSGPTGTVWKNESAAAAGSVHATETPWREFPVTVSWNRKHNALYFLIFMSFLLKQSEDAHFEIKSLHETEHPETMLEASDHWWESLEGIQAGNIKIYLCS